MIMEHKLKHEIKGARVELFVFPSRSIATDPRTGVVRRHHAHEQALQRIIKGARVELFVMFITS